MSENDPNRLLVQILKCQLRGLFRSLEMGFLELSWSIYLT
ncbi:hypothetical protein B0F87_1133 [Methylobacter tundripaludum]|uniref:Uncharacterized protein n=1 Tax=Methylobacter tundripaludum TaxID=173365 RepID=A0A2S6H8S5_9GAMM|nr:hypothetical protein B0F87_1133 [Methylobacter tundripaludum]